MYFASKNTGVSQPASIKFHVVSVFINQMRKSVVNHLKYQQGVRSTTYYDSRNVALYRKLMDLSKKSNAKSSYHLK